MKTGLRFLYLLAAICLLAGCSAQKQAAKSVAVTAESEALYAQALKALDDGRFVIEAEEFYFPGPKSRIQPATGSYFSLQDRQARLVFTPNLFPGTPLEHLNIVDNSAELQKEPAKKNGDRQFSVTMDGGKSYLRRNLLITLYKDTDRCFVQELGVRTGQTVISFSGKVVPLSE